MEPSSSADGATDPPDKGETQVFRLLDLPDELWSRIGKMAVDEEPMNWLQGKPKHRLPALLHTCAPLRHELLEYWCATKLSCAPDAISKHLLDIENVGNWLKILPAPARRSIRGLHIFLGHDSLSETWLLLMNYILSSKGGIAYELEEVEPLPLGREKGRWFKIKFL